MFSNFALDEGMLAKLQSSLNLLRRRKKLNLQKLVRMRRLDNRKYSCHVKENCGFLTSIFQSRPLNLWISGERCPSCLARQFFLGHILWYGIHRIRIHLRGFVSRGLWLGEDVFIEDFLCMYKSLFSC